VSVTVRAVLQALDRRRQLAQVAALDDLTVAEAEAVREALAGQRAGAKIDLHILVETVRAEVAKQRRAEAERLRADAPMMAFRYELSLMSLPQLVAARENLLAGGDVRTAIARARREIGQEGQSKKQPPSRPRSLPRAPSRRARPEPVDESVPGPILADHPTCFHRLRRPFLSVSRLRGDCWALDCSAPATSTAVPSTPILIVGARPGDRGGCWRKTIKEKRPRDDPTSSEQAAGTSQTTSGGSPELKSGCKSLLPAHFLPIAQEQ